MATSDPVSPTSKGGDKIKGMFKRKTRDKETPDPVKQKLAAIREHVQRPDSSVENFVTTTNLRKVWKWELKNFIETAGLGFDASNEQLDFIEEKLLKTLSILVYIRWEKWPKFPKIFMKGGEFRDDRLDDKLPYTRDVLKDKNFLGNSWGPSFFEAQYIFVPIILRQGEILSYPKGRRLPLNTGGKVLGSGAYGKVTREVIPEGQLVLKHEGKATCPGDYEVARKVILVEKDYKVERRNLEKLREGLREHKHIVMNIAAVAIGNEFNLFFDIAKTDLSAFLYGLTDPVDLKMLIGEALNLVDALHFLHDELSSDRGDSGTAQKVCYHADLKPENILVYGRPDNPEDIIGRWKITDFGISRIDTLPHGESTSSGTNATIVVEQRVRGIYTAPETDAGRLSDIWSFGCIFHQVLTAGLGGGSLIEKLDKEREKITDDGGSFQSPSFYREEGSGKKKVLKSCVIRWVENELPKHPSRPADDVVTRECSKLIMKMLQIDKTRRPNASAVKIWLGNILDEKPTLEPPEPVGGTAGPLAPKPGKGKPVSTPPLSSALISAIETTNPSPVYERLRKGDKILARDGDGRCALHHAARVGGRRVLQQLLKWEEFKGDNINGIDQQDNSGATPLHYAASGGKKEIASELIKAGADKDAKDEYGRTPLHMAALGCNEKHTDLVEFLLDSGAKLTPNLPPQFKVKQNFILFRKHKREKMKSK